MINGTATFVKRQMGSRHAQPIIESTCKKMLINLLAVDPKLRTLLVAGCSPGDGATTIASFLARHLAEVMNRRVLLIDANFDHPCVDAIFPSRATNPARGEGVGLEPCPTDYSRIDIIPLGQLAAATKRVFDTDNFVAALRRFEKDYDLTLIDAASPTSCPDTLLLAPHVNGVLLVVQAERTRRQVAAKAKEDLEAVGARSLGAVLNRRLHVIPDFIYRYL